jgi:glutaredoxin 3
MGNAVVGSDRSNKLSSRTPEEKIQEFIEAENNSHQVVVWSKSYCGYCSRAIASLEKRSQDVKVHQLDREKHGDRVQKVLEKMTSQSTVPNVFINGKHIGGNDAVQRLKKSGELKAMLKLTKEVKTGVDCQQ